MRITRLESRAEELFVRRSIRMGEYLSTEYFSERRRHLKSARKLFRKSVAVVHKMQIRGELDEPLPKQPEMVAVYNENKAYLIINGAR